MLRTWTPVLPTLPARHPVTLPTHMANAIPNSSSGFTLLELMIASTIIIAVTGGILVNYNSFTDRQRLKQSALNLKNNLRLAQSKAIAGQKPPGVACTTLVGFRLTFQASRYTTQASCQPQGLVGNIDTVDLPSGVTFSPVPGSFTFQILTRGLSTNSDASLTLTSGAQNLQLLVERGGSIKSIGF